MRTHMYRSLRLLTIAAAMSFTVTCLAACGSGDGDDAPITQASDSRSPDLVVAKVGGMSITKGTLSHWMATNVAGVYLEHVGRRAPKGLVSDPPNYVACVSAIETIGPSKVSGKGEQVRAQLEQKCRQLYEAIKQLALVSLIEGLWNEAEADEQGIDVTADELEQALAKMKAEQYPTKAAFKKFLLDNGRTVSDERYLLQRNLVSTRLEHELRGKLGQKLKSPEAITRALIESYNESVKKWSAGTECRPGYVVSVCSRYRTPTTQATSAALLVERIAASRYSG